MERGKDQMSGQGGLNADLCCLRVPYLAHQNNIRVLANDGSEALGERQIYFRVYLDLSNSIDLIFNRVFDRNDVDFGSVDCAQGAIQGCRFSATRGARD